MTRDEAIRAIGWMKCTTNREDDLEAIDMAIEALSQPIVAKHFDIQSGYIYCSPEIAENVKVVVRCKDCIHYEKHESWSACTYWSGDPYEQASVIDEDFCSYGERRKT